MKNVSKCDTWCELQNPVNHRVFECKLRPKPLGRGHVCLGVTRRCPHEHCQKRVQEGRRLASHEHCLVVGLNSSRRPQSPRYSCLQRDPRSGGITR
ncbi:hypothetical protein CsatB_022968 [Cannabis sativa]